MGFSFGSLIRRLSIIIFLSAYYGLVHPARAQWLRLTQENFTSEIHKASHVLCIATVPWCGESRKLMEDVSKAIKEDETLHSLVKLRVVYVNLDKNLGALIVGKGKTPSLSLYVESVPFKYNGKLRVQNILAGIRHAASMSSSEFPFQRLESASEVNSFLQFTDRAVIVFDNCNYAERISKKKKRLLEKKLTSESSYNHKQENEETLVQSLMINKTGEGEQHINDDHVGQAATLMAQASSEGQSVLQESPMVDSENLYIHDKEVYDGVSKMVATDKLQSSWNNSLTKESINRERDPDLMVCESEINPSSSFFISSFPAKNISSTLDKSDFCDQLDYKHFTILYKNLTRIARAHVLTPERMNFGIIRNQSLLAELKIYRSQRDKWLLMVQVVDQLKMPHLYFDDAAMESLTSRSAVVLPELDHSIASHHSALNSGNPVAILFIDRVSPSIDVRKQCWEALKVFRSLVRENMGTKDLENEHVSSKNDLERESLTQSGKSLAAEDNLKEIRSENKVYILDPNLKRQVSNIILNIRDSFSSDGLNADTGTKKGNSENENDLNLQFLKGDGNIVVKVLLDDEIKMQLPKLSSGNSQTLEVKSIRSEESNIIYNEDHNTIMQKEKMGPSNLVDATVESIISSPPVSLVEQNNLEKIVDNDYVSSIEIMEDNSDDVQSLQDSLSYVFVDGEDRMKEMILPGYPYPSLVILDPSTGGQFVFPLSDQLNSSSSVKTFIHEFGRHSLPNNYLSEPGVKNPRIQVQPPFVNRDFHEMNGVPRVTTKTLLEMLEGRHNGDHLVLFTVPSCGFCARMGLVFREVHQLLSLQLNTKVRHLCMEKNIREDQRKLLDTPNKIRESCWSQFKDNLPHLLQIDCTLNDCAAFFQAPYQQSYPSIMLFTDSEMYSPVIFEGRPVVNEILDFIASKSNIHPDILHFFQGASRGQVQHHSFPSLSIQIDSTAKGAQHLYQFAEDAKQHVASSDVSNFEAGNEYDHPNVETDIQPKIGSVLVATEKVSSSKTFEKSIILIVKADIDQGFQGLILNKPASWDLLHFWLDKTVEAVLNKTVLCYGGPVVTYEQPFLSLSATKDFGGFSEVVPGLFYGDVTATEHVFTLMRTSELDPTEFWFFLGYAGWTWQQLLDELALGMWELTDYEKGTASLTQRVHSASPR